VKLIRQTVNICNGLAWWVLGVTLTATVAAHAASTQVTVGATIVSPAYVDAAAFTQVLLSTSTGAFSISMPGAAETQGSPWVDALVLTVADDYPARESQLAALIVTDGTLTGKPVVSFSWSGGGGLPLVGTVAFN
jgi:hypothetical protein